MAGLLLGIGSSFTNQTMLEAYGLTGVIYEGSVPYTVLDIMNQCGSAVFNNLALLFLIETVVQRRHTQAHDDAAKDAHLQGGDTQHGGGGVGRHGLHAAPGGDHGGDGGVHDQVGDGAGEGRHLRRPG